MIVMDLSMPMLGVSNLLRDFHNMLKNDKLNFRGMLYLFPLVLILLIITMHSAKATCTYQSGQGPYTYSFNVGNVVVQRDTAVGASIYTSTLNPGGVQLACSNDNQTTYAMTYMGGVATAISHAYATNVSGVAVSVKIGNTWGYLDNPVSHDNDGNGAITYPQATITLYKTGSMASGALTTGNLGTYTVSGLTPGTYQLTGGSITVLACSISTPTLSFPIGDISASSFGSTIGVTPSSAQNTQNLGLNCDAGANINVSLSGTQNPDVGTTSVLALTGQGSAGVAKGVGVQIVYNGSPLILNNRVVLKQSAGGQETFPLTARYYQTKTSVTPGTANASATLNLTYQ